jgi:hypothetical protein
MDKLEFPYFSAMSPARDVALVKDLFNKFERFKKFKRLNALLNKHFLLLSNVSCKGRCVGKRFVQKV